MFVQLVPICYQHWESFCDPGQFMRLPHHIYWRQLRLRTGYWVVSHRCWHLSSCIFCWRQSPMCWSPICSAPPMASTHRAGSAGLRGARRSEIWIPACRQGGPWWSGMNILQRLLDCCYMEAAQEILRCSEIEHCCNTKFVCRRQVHIFSNRRSRFIPSASLSIFSPNVEFDFFFEAFHLVLQLWAWARHNSHLSPRLAQNWQIRRVVIKSRTKQAEKQRNMAQKSRTDLKTKTG